MVHLPTAHPLRQPFGPAFGPPLRPLPGGRRCGGAAGPDAHTDGQADGQADGRPDAHASAHTDAHADAHTIWPPEALADGAGPAGCQAAPAPLGRRLLSWASACLLASLFTACGGGGGGSGDAAAGGTDLAARSVNPVSLEASFPVGLALAAPTDLGSAGLSITIAAARANTGVEVEVGTPAVLAQAAQVAGVLAGDAQTPLAAVLDLPLLFGAVAGDAACHGLPVAYANHQDAPAGTAASGLMPLGELGLWAATEGDGSACAAAQLAARTGALKEQTRQGLLLAAAMRQAVAANPVLGMPGAGDRTDLTSAFQTVLSAATTRLGYSLAVERATIALDADGQRYEYHLVLGNGGSGTAYRRAEVLLRHRPGAGDTDYAGLLRVAGFGSADDPANGCADQMVDGRYANAQVATLRYARSGRQLQLGGRQATYCGRPAAGDPTDLAPQVAQLTDAGELDPAAATRTGLRGSGRGWRSGFTRWGASHDAELLAGTFRLAWQASPDDTLSHGLAAQVQAIGGDLLVQLVQAHGDPVGSAGAALRGLACNRVGPGGSDAVLPLFQSQTARKTATGSLFLPEGPAHLAYAPTRSCSSSGTRYDANGDGWLDAGEGQGLAHALDAPAPGLDLPAELARRGFEPTALF